MRYLLESRWHSVAYGCISINQSLHMGDRTTPALSFYDRVSAIAYSYRLARPKEVLLVPLRSRKISQRSNNRSPSVQTRGMTWEGSDSPTYFGVRIPLGASYSVEFELVVLLPPGLKVLSTSTGSISYTKFGEGARVELDFHCRRDLGRRKGSLPLTRRSRTAP